MGTAGPQRADRMPEDMPEDMPDRMPDRMPEDMPDKMPEDMPDRMPEDMPENARIVRPDRMMFLIGSFGTRESRRSRCEKLKEKHPEAGTGRS